MTATELKRRAERIRRRFPARLEREDGISVRGTVGNFSEMGLLIKSGAVFRSREPVTVHLEPAPGRSMALRGIVVWNRERPGSFPGVAAEGVGIALAAVSDEYLRFIEETRKPSSPPPRTVEERFETYFRAEVVHGADRFPAHIENLSHGGLYLATDCGFCPGTGLLVRLEIPGVDEPLDLLGEVVYALDSEAAERIGRSLGVGLRFGDLTPRSRAVLHHFLSRMELHRSRPDRRRTGPLPSAGSLAEFLVPEILLGLKDSFATGVLILERDGMRKEVFFKNGLPVHASSTLRTDSLGAYLLRDGILNAESALALTGGAGDDSELAQKLLADGVLDSRALAEALIGRHEDCIANTFPWFEGDFSFKECSEWPDTVSPLPLRLYHTLFRGAQRWYDPLKVSTWMGVDGKSALRRVSMPPPEASVPPAVFRLLQRAVKPRTIAELSKESGMDEGALVSLAFAFVLLGWAVLDFSLEGRPAAEPERPAEKVPEKSKQPSYAEKRLRRLIEGDFEKLATLDFYELLGLAAGFDEEKLKDSFGKLSANYSGHKIASIPDAELRDKAAQILGWMRLAYDTLGDSHMRRMYARRGGGKKGKTADPARSEAERLFFQGVRLLEAGNAKEALSLFHQASDADPRDAQIQGYYGRALFEVNRKENLQKSTDMLSFALEREASDPNLHFFMGEVHAFLGNWARAERCFDQALRLAPQFPKAVVAQDNARRERIAVERITRSK